MQNQRLADWLDPVNRTHKAYQAVFRALLARTGARRPDQGVQWLFRRAQARAPQQPLPSPGALADVYAALLRKLRRRRARATPSGAGAPPRFWCDAGLGGLARWLRAAGYEAAWQAGISDDDLLERARSEGAVLLTTDSLLMERRAVRQGEVAALWLHPSLTPTRQLALLVDHLDLALLPGRCMSCGGLLRPVDKEALRERIPPRTYRWLDRYFQCQDCGRILWHGTHWQRIRRKLADLPGP